MSSKLTSLPRHLKNPPSYTAVPSSRTITVESSCAPPPYTPTASAVAPTSGGSDKHELQENEKEPVRDDVLHFLNHDHDSIASLSLRYGVPAAALRHANRITSDHLLLARRTVSIPGAYYKGRGSLSPRPIEGEEEEVNKAKIRRFMTFCKEPDYDVALLYLERSYYDLGASVDAYLADGVWERRHPQELASKSSTQVKIKRPFWHGQSPQ